MKKAANVELENDEEIFDEIDDLFGRLVEEADGHDVQVVLYTLGMMLAYASRHFRNSEVEPILEMLDGVMRHELAYPDDSRQLDS